MQKIFKFLMVSLILSFLQGFPLTKWITYTPGIDFQVTTILQTMLETSGTDIIIYASLLDKTMLFYKIRQVNASASPPALLNTYSLSFASPLQTPPLITLLNTSLAISFTDSSGSYVVRVSKTSFTLLERYATNFDTGGVYLSTHDLAFYHMTIEALLYKPEGGAQKVALGSYTSGSADYLHIKYLYTLDQSKIFTLYTDLPYFLARNLTTLSQIQSSYTQPLSFSMSEKGYQCSCLNSNSTILFILLHSGTLKLFDTSLETYTASISVG